MVNQDEATKLWSLEELSQLSQQELERRRIPNPGGRVSQVPSARTIRYYTSLGLVDRPLGYEGGVAQYGPRHLLQLLAIKVLQAEYLPLPEIQKQLFGRSEEELQKIVEAATREEPAQLEPRPELQMWMTRQVLPGVRLVVENRQALLEWMRNHSSEEAKELIGEGLAELVSPAGKG